MASSLLYKDALNRPPLSKKLWHGKKEVKDIFLCDRSFYDRNGVTLLLNRRVVAIDANDKTVRDSNGEIHRFGKLLLATVGAPNTLPIPGGNLEGVCYYRFLDDYQRMRSEAVSGKSAVIIGGVFIGSEMAAALRVNKLKVTMIYPAAYLCDRAFPEDLRLAMERLFESRGIRIMKCHMFQQNRIVPIGILMHLLVQWLTIETFLSASFTLIPRSRPISVAL